ncbi:MAG: RNA polymerase sigma factor [Evtepia sp.]
MSALCCPRVRSGTGWFSALKEALRRVFFSTEETALPLQPSRAKVNERATALLDRHGESILRLAYSYLHNQSDAEDILQDTLIQYLRTAPVLESPAHEKPGCSGWRGTSAKICSAPRATARPTSWRRLWWPKSGRTSPMSGRP